MSELTTSEQNALNLFGVEPIQFNRIPELLDMDEKKVASLMVMLELKGKVCQLPGKKYAKSFDSLVDDLLETANPTRAQIRALIGAASHSVVRVAAYTDGRICIKERRADKRGQLRKNLNRRFDKVVATHLDNYGKGLIYYETSLVHSNSDYTLTTIRLFRDLESHCIGYPV